MPDPVLISTKLRAPAVRPALVPRDRLVDWLTARRPHRLTLVEAPAGWGKTTLLAEWSASPTEERPLAWVTLDRADNDPVRFWAYAIEALRTVRPGVGGRFVAALPATTATSSTTWAARCWPASPPRCRSPPAHLGPRPLLRAPVRGGDRPAGRGGDAGGDRAGPTCS